MQPNLARRNRQDEIMDSPDLPPERLHAVLDGLSLVNAFTFSRRILWPDIRAALRRKPVPPLRVLDIACGAGDVLIRMHKLARRKGLPIEFAGCDMSAAALEHARRAAIKAKAEIGFFQHVVPRDGIPAGYDVVMSSLFLHHLDEKDAVAFLRQASRQAGDRLIVHDLSRSRTAYRFASIGTRLLFLNDICRGDGERSVESAFTLPEAEKLARKAGLEDAEVVSRLPFRFLLRWVRHAPAA